MFTSSIDSSDYIYVRAVFTSIYLLWAGLWLIVAYHYGHSAYASWKGSGGNMRRAIPDSLSPFWWAIRETMCRWSLLRGSNFCGTTIPHKYQPGNLLQFAIFLSSLTPIVFGIQFSDLDRHTWSWAHLITTALFALVSIFGAGSHLFLAYRNYPNSWRKTIMNTIYWLIFSPPLFLLLYHFFPTAL